jgi:hypothetical protein
LAEGLVCFSAERRVADGGLEQRPEREEMRDHLGPGRAAAKTPRLVVAPPLPQSRGLAVVGMEE